MQNGHPCGGDLHTQVSAGHHNAVCGLQNGVQVVHTLLVLNLGDNLYVVAAALPKNLPDGLYVRRPPDKRGGDKVEIVFHTKADVVDVLFGEGGELDVDPGDVDGLIGGQSAAVFHGADNFSILNPVHPDGN